MKKLLIGAALGIAAGYMIRKMQEEHQFDKLSDCANKITAKGKKQVKNAMDLAQNEAEYILDRAEHVIEKSREKLGKRATQADK